METWSTHWRDRIRLRDHPPAGADRMKHIPLYLRMQGDPRRQRAEQIHNEMYQEYGITYGTPGSATESDVRGKLDAILASGEGQGARLDALEALHWWTANNVEYGGVSDVLREVDDAFEAVLYEKKD